MKQPSRVLALGLVAGALLLSSATGSGCSCSQMRDNTQVIASIDADPGVRMRARVLHVLVYGPPYDENGVPVFVVRDVTFDLADYDWPIVVALAPEGRDATRRYRVEAIARDAAETHVATARAISGYVAEQTLLLPVRLLDRCIGVTCEDPGQTCFGPDDCRDATVDPIPLDAGVPSMDGGPTPDGGAECVDADCDDGFDCTLDFCGPGGACVSMPRDAMCDDGEVCTTDACTGTGEGDGCTHAPNTVACDDGVYCNGIDVCADGACVHPGDPCLGSTTCSETMGACVGCATRPDCPAGGETLGACTYADPTCGEVAMQPRTMIDYECVATICMESRETDSVACGSRSTTGTSCGATSCGAYGPCDGATECALTGMQSRSCTDRVCSAGTCGTSARSETQTCTRDTSTTFCEDGDPCTDMDMCMGGVCVPGIFECDAGTFDAGGDSGTDAGRDSSVDSGRDADAGPPCVAMPSLCDDGDECTTDECGLGFGDANGCSHVVMAPCGDDAGLP